LAVPQWLHHGSVSTSRSSNRNAAAESIGQNATAAALDITDEHAINSKFAEFAKIHGHLDLLVNNAGLAIRKASLDLALDDWNKVVAVNMTGLFLCAQAAAHRRSHAAARIAQIEHLTPLGRLAEPEEIAAAILFLASPAVSMITGHILVIDRG
jgi:NAD(P)-dependent dehydrogenase (short-subunit alcohol dehydrogenase family)